MRDLCGVLCLILAGWLVTVHFALGIIPGIAGFALLSGKRPINDYTEIVVPIGMLSAVVVIVWSLLAELF